APAELGGPAADRVDLGRQLRGQVEAPALLPRAGGDADQVAVAAEGVDEVAVDRGGRAGAAAPVVRLEVEEGPDARGPRLGGRAVLDLLEVEGHEELGVA